MSDGRRIADGPNVFALGRDELRAMILDHVENVRHNLAKVRAQLEREIADAPDIVGDTRFTSRREIMESAVSALQKRIEEHEWLATHIAPQGRFVMSAAELLSFRGSFGKIELNVDQMILSASMAPVPDRQAERALHSGLVQVPRISLPHGLVG